MAASRAPYGVRKLFLSTPRGCPDRERLDFASRRGGGGRCGWVWVVGGLEWIGVDGVD